jgi:GTPase SAR1 family protein
MNNQYKDCMLQDNTHILNIELSSINKFNLTNATAKTKFKNTFLLIGKKSSGKTTLIKELAINLFNENKIDHGIIFSSLESNNEQLSECFDCNTTIYYNLDSQILKSIIDNQRINNINNILIVIDDCILKSSINTNEYFKEIIINGRHLNIYLILSLRQQLSIKADIRINFDYIFVFQDENISTRKRLYEHYFGIIPSFTIFNDLMNKLPDYHILVSNNISTSKNITNKLLYYVTNVIKSIDKKIPLLKLTYEYDDLSDYSNSDDEISLDNKEIIKQININNSKIIKLQNKNKKLLDNIV